MHNQVVSRSPQEVIQIVQSLAPNAGPTGCKIEEKVAEQEWLIIIDEGIPGEKFNHYEISFRILAQESKGTEDKQGPTPLFSRHPRTRVVPHCNIESGFNITIPWWCPHTDMRAG
ncbi:MAG: hypothetical protein GX615_03145 [Lentisphaerae bacterium]|nr:hypothetical protein [Lentisphaerota bacterium]